MMSEPSALVLFSAGQDSTTCLAWALARYARVETVGFDYGQRHRIELAQRPIVLDAVRSSFPDWSRKLGADHMIDLSSYGALAASALTADLQIETPEGALPTTFVPGRNLVFLAYAGALAYQRRIGALVAGMCETDFAGYPDCRQATIDAMALALRLGLDCPLVVATPLMRLTKAETWTLADELGGAALVDLIRKETHTCYRGDRTHRWAWGRGCGDCPACRLRAAGWAEYAARASR
jgi:7-cyano-7-deazaguanine synthase